MVAQPYTTVGSMAHENAEQRRTLNMRIGGIIGFFLMLVGITIAWGAWYTVGQSERGVLLRYGAMIADNVEPGLHWKTPWIDAYDTISVATQRSVYGDTDAIDASTGERYAQMEAYSRDQQPAHFKISVNWHVPADRVGEVYWRYGGLLGLKDRLLDRHIPQQSKTVFGKFNALTLIQERNRFDKEVFDAMLESTKGEPIVIESIQTENVVFSEDYIFAVKARMIAEVEVQKLKQQEEQQKVNASITVINADAEAQKTRSLASGAADARLAQATAEAKAIELQGLALADALALKGKALAENPGLIQLQIAEKWSGVLPTQMIPGGTVPFINVSPQVTGPASPFEVR